MVSGFKLIKLTQISYIIIYATLIKILLHFLLFHYSNFAPAHRVKLVMKQYIQKRSMFSGAISNLKKGFELRTTFKSGRE